MPAKPRERIVLLTVYDGDEPLETLADLGPRIFDLDGFYVVAAKDEYFSDLEVDQFTSLGDRVVEIEIEAPRTLAEALLAQGTTDQVFSDGLEAWEAVQTGKVRLVAIAPREAEADEDDDAWPEEDSGV